MFSMPNSYRMVVVSSQQVACELLGALFLCRKVGGE